MDAFSLLYARHRRAHRSCKLSQKELRYTELTLVLDGKLEYFDGDTPLVLEAGDVLYLRKGSLRSRVEGEAPADYVSFNFNLDRDFALPPVIRGGIGGEIRFYLEAVDRILEKRYLPNSTEQLSHLILTVLLSLEDSLRAKKVNPLVHKISLFLHSRLGERVTLKDVAEHCFFSPVYCDSVFKRETGGAIMAYLTKIRMEEAKLLLIQGQFSVARIGEMVGYPDANYFSRAFRKYTGHSPSAFRRLFLQE